MIILKPKEVSETLKVSLKAVYALIKQRHLAAFWVGGRLRIVEADLHKYVHSEAKKNGDCRTNDREEGKGNGSR
jgi:excisionase family DNA binding protein